LVGCAVVCPSGFVVKLKPAVAGCVEGGTPGLVRTDCVGRLNPPTVGCGTAGNLKFNHSANIHSSTWCVLIITLKVFLPHLAEDYVSFFHHLMSFVRRKLAL
jgi:hypothetical protein